MLRSGSAKEAFESSPERFSRSAFPEEKSLRDSMIRRNPQGRSEGGGGTGIHAEGLVVEALAVIQVRVLRRDAQSLTFRHMLYCSDRMSFSFLNRFGCARAALNYRRGPGARGCPGRC